MNDETRRLIEKMHHFYSEENPVGSLAESVFVRPGMYTINGTLEEARSFLEGFYSGMAAHNRNPQAQTEAQRWFDFCPWAAKQIDGAEPGGWRNLFVALRRTYANDTAAFLRLAELYIAFRRAHNAATK